MVESKNKGAVTTGIALAWTAILSVPAQAVVQQTEGRGTPRATASEVIADSGKSEWRRPNAEDLVVFDFETGRVVIEMVPAFAPKHLARVRELVRAGWFDGGAVVRSQDNYVVQWTAREPGEGSAVPKALASALEAEFERSSMDVPFVGIEDADPYAPETGFAVGQRVARDPETGTMWLVHCYGAVGVARDVDPGSGNGTQLYAVIGHAPRHLDRNMTVIGHVISGIEHLSTLPRGTEALGFYATEEEKVPLKRSAVAADLPVAERPEFELLRTDSPSFGSLITARRTRTEPFFAHSVDAIGLCNVPVPVRAVSDGGGS